MCWICGRHQISDQGQPGVRRTAANILAGRSRPGTKLPFGELSERHKASMGVVREAVSRLVAEGLVESMPQQGLRVTPVSAETCGT
ncbi:GntR family transcriptional regulator [Mycobacterium sp. BMJ-28]